MKAQELYDHFFGSRIIDEQMQLALREIDRKKEEIIKEYFAKKGFGHLMEGIEKRRFPGICCERKQGWELYYADNGTDQGVFIIAIKEMEFKQSMADDITGNTFKAEIFSTYQDFEPEFL